MRTVQPVLEEMERDVEDAAASLGASRFTTFRRVIAARRWSPRSSPARRCRSPAASASTARWCCSAATCPTAPRSPRSGCCATSRAATPASAAAVATILLVVALFAIVTLDIIQRRVARRG